MSEYVQTVRSWLGRILETGAGSRARLPTERTGRRFGTGTFPKNMLGSSISCRDSAYWAAGAAEGVLSLLLAQNKEKVFALEMKRERHGEALRLKSSWQERGLDVGRCEMVHGNIKDQLHILKSVDTLLAVRSIYYLRGDLTEGFDRSAGMCRTSCCAETGTAPANMLSRIAILTIRSARPITMRRSRA